MSVLQKTKLCVPNVRYYSKLTWHLPFRSLIVKSFPSAYVTDLLCTKDFQNCSYQKCLVYSRRWKSGKNDISSLVVPVPIKPGSNPDDINVGEELTGKLKKDDLLKILNQFYKQPEIKALSEENGLDSKLYHQAAVSFRRFCMESDTLPVDLHIVFSDILQSAGHIDDIFPYFLQHCRQMYPHLECLDDLKKISDLRIPANWYPEARAINRKIIFHAGPTNSGKTYHALERFTSAKSGVYCGPLKLLATEVFNKTNEMETPCDLVTGEERRYVLPDDMPANHVSCTVEMASVLNRYEVAIIDEIQMIRDQSRGWAWTRALLGLAADEIHICGEEAALNLVKEIATSVGEEVEVRRYKRLTKLTVQDHALESLDNVRPGDCIVCFSKNDIFSVSLKLERKGYECAVIYGGLPPGTKLSQAKKFNDPNDPCKILVSTDAIGMGLNLSIRRVIFYSLIKPVLNEKGEKEMDTISTSQALQIGGRAGRFNTQFSEGFVTTFRNDDLTVLKSIMARSVETIEIAGLHPTAEQIELFAYHLPHATLSNLIDIFVSLSQLDTASYFMCNIEDFKFLADMIQHVPLPLRARYVFCCAPINKKLPFVCTMFLKFARQYGRNDPLTFDWLCRTIGWPFAPPKTIIDLVHLESVFDVLDLYLWFSYRFADLFPDVQLVRDMQSELDEVIQHGVLNITHLVRAGEAGSSYATVPDDDFAQKGIEEDDDEFGRNLPSNRSKNSSVFQSKKLFFPENDDETEVESSQSKHVNIGKGNLTNHLLSRGLITPRMLEELKKEWEHSMSSNEDPNESESPRKSHNRSSRINPRRRTKKK